MRSFFLINFLVHISLIAIACVDDSTSDDLLYPETIMGHWDIEGGGTLFFEEENFSASVGCNTLSVNVIVEVGVKSQDAADTNSVVANFLITSL